MSGFNRYHRRRRRRRRQPQGCGCLIVAILIIAFSLTAGCASFWSIIDMFPDEDEPKRAVITMEDGTVYMAEEVVQ